MNKKVNKLKEILAKAGVLARQGVGTAAEMVDPSGIGALTYALKTPQQRSQDQADFKDNPMALAEALVMGTTGGRGAARPQKFKIKDLISHEGAPDKGRVLEYETMIEQGNKIEPLRLIKEGAKYGVEDGKHRLQAYINQGYDTIEGIVQGSRKANVNPLFEEAKKYKSADEFVLKAKGSSTQYEPYNPILRAKIPAGYKNLTDLGIDPDKMITVYRGIDDKTGKVKKAINDGDFVTTDFDSALSYTGDPKNVVKMQVKAKELYNSEPRDFADEPFYLGSEYIYTKKKSKSLPSDDELIDIWNKAMGKQPGGKGGAFDDPMVDEGQPEKPQGYQFKGMTQFQPQEGVIPFEEAMGMMGGDAPGIGMTNDGQVLDFESAMAMLQQPDTEDAHDHAEVGHGKSYINSGLGKLRTPQDVPIPGRITQTFDTKVGYTKSGRHGGLDIAVPTGTPIPSKVGGQVIAVQDQGGKDYGKMVLVKGDDGIIRRYGHLSQFGVKQGQRIEPGQTIGAVGSTGRSSGAHLHYEEIEE